MARKSHTLSRTEKVMKCAEAIGEGNLRKVPLLSVPDQVKFVDKLSAEFNRRHGEGLTVGDVEALFLDLWLRLMPSIGRRAADDALNEALYGNNIPAALRT